MTANHPEPTFGAGIKRQIYPLALHRRRRAPALVARRQRRRGLAGGSGRSFTRISLRAWRRGESG